MQHTLRAAATAPPAAPRRGRSISVCASAGAPPAAAAGTVALGKSGVVVSEMGLGAWSWGDRSGYWSNNTPEAKDAAEAAYVAAIEAGLTFIDTAEVYGFGKSEEFIREFGRAHPELAARAQLATKFAPLPWRQSADSVPDALRKSLARLGAPKVPLYQQHWPGFFLNAFANDAYLEGLARCVELGLADAVGVSNFNAARVRGAARALEARGTCLASNQVQYSLIYRGSERSGVVEACAEAGATVIAYSPIAQGLLSGKYSAANPPAGPRRAFFTDARFKDISVLIDLLKKVGAEHGGATPAQVSLNWLLCKGALPIPGAKTAAQVADLAGALGWRLSEGEVAELDAVSARIPSSSGAPFEKW